MPEPCNDCVATAETIRHSNISEADVVTFLCAD